MSRGRQGGYNNNGGGGGYRNNNNRGGGGGYGGGGYGKNNNGGGGLGLCLAEPDFPFTNRDTYLTPDGELKFCLNPNCDVENVPVELATSAKGYTVYNWNCDCGMTLKTTAVDRNPGYLESAIADHFANDNKSKSAFIRKLRGAPKPPTEVPKSKKQKVVVVEDEDEGNGSEEKQEPNFQVSEELMNKFEEGISTIREFIKMIQQLGTEQKADNESTRSFMNEARNQLFESTKRIAELTSVPTFSAGSPNLDGFFSEETMPVFEDSKKKESQLDPGGLLAWNPNWNKTKKLATIEESKTEEVEASGTVKAKKVPAKSTTRTKTTKQ